MKTNIISNRKNNKKPQESSGRFKKELIKNRYLYLLLLLPIVYYIVFRYLPMVGNIIAFRRYKLGLSMFGTEWVGFKYFSIFMKDMTFWNAFKNSLVLSLMNIAIGFPIPIIFALLVNEIRSVQAKKLIQTVSYLPKFISTIVAVGMIKEMLSPSTGVVNSVLGNLFGLKPIFFVNDPDWFRMLYIGSDLWQFMGWNAIIYLAALSGVDQEQYESSVIDGANRLQQTRYVTIPGIMPTIVVTFVLSVGYMLSLGFEKALLFYTPMNSSTSDILETFVYRIGLQNNNYSYATAVGLFSGIIGLILVGSTNYLSKKFSDISIY